MNQYTWLFLLTSFMGVMFLLGMLVVPPAPFAVWIIRSFSVIFWGLLAWYYYRESFKENSRQNALTVKFVSLYLISIKEDNTEEEKNNALNQMAKTKNKLNRSSRKLINDFKRNLKVKEK